MAWLLFILFLFFAWRAAAYFRQGRPQPAILSLGACAVFLAGIFSIYMIERQRADPPAPAPEPALAEAPAAPPSPVAVETAAPADLEGFYGDTMAEEAEPAADEVLVSDDSGQE